MIALIWVTLLNPKKTTKMREMPFKIGSQKERKHKNEKIRNVEVELMTRFSRKNATSGRIQQSVKGFANSKGNPGL